MLSSSIRDKKWDGSDEQKMEFLGGEHNDENEKDNEEEESAFWKQMYLSVNLKWF